MLCSNTISKWWKKFVNSLIQKPPVMEKSLQAICGKSVAGGEQERISEPELLALDLVRGLDFGITFSLK